MASSNQSDSKHIEDEQLREPTAEDLEQVGRRTHHLLDHASFLIT